MRPRILSKSQHRDGVLPIIVILSLLTLIALPSGRDAVGQVGTNQRPGYRQATDSPDDVVPGVVVVKLKRSGSLMKTGPLPNADAALQAFAKYGVTSVNRAFPRRVPLSDAAVRAGKVDLSQIYFVTIPAGVNPIEIAAELARSPGVEYAEPKYRYRLCDVPNDSDYVSAQQPYFDLMHVAGGWALQKGSRDVVIAAVDGGTNWQHPDLAANMWVNPGEDINHSGAFEKTPVSEGGDLNGVDDDHNGHIDDLIGWNFGSPDSCDPRGFLPVAAAHGTGTASDFGAVTDNNRGMAGTSWNCRVMAVCVSHATEDENPCYWLEGLEYASRMGARVVNCSLYRAGGPDNPLQHEQDVITAATEQGTLIVAAAGNNGQNLDTKPWYPASYEHVLSVGATQNGSDEVAHFSNLGLNVSAFAPGVAIRVARDDGSYGTDQGTSHSSPLVAGLAGLLFSKHPDWTPEMVAEQIHVTSDPIDAVNPGCAGRLGHGRVNFERALSEVHAGVVATAGHFQTSRGRTQYYMEGDTVILSVKLKNVLTLAAENLTFNVATSSELVPLGLPRAPSRLDASAEDSLDCRFRVGEVNGNGLQTVSVRLGWSANGTESDAHIFTITLYPGNGHWEYQKSPTSLPLYDIHAVNERIVWAVGNDYGNSDKAIVLRTTDGGENWISVIDEVVTANVAGIPMTLTFAPISIAAVDSLHAWAAGGQCGMIFVTTDGGVSWTQQSIPSPQSLLMKKIWFFDALNGYAWGEPLGDSGPYVIVRTTDGGATWTHLPNEPLAVKQAWTSRAFCCTDMQHIWFGTPDSWVYRSTDGGNTWLSNRVGTGVVTAIAMRDDSIGIECSGEEAPPSFARTTDGGATWQGLPIVIPEPGYVVAWFPGPRVWIGGGRQVACSQNSGLTWELEPTNPIGQYMTGVSFGDSKHGWMVTIEGQILQYRDRSTTSVRVDPDRVLPTEFLLEQNYPNPFNPFTTIKYTVGGNGAWGVGDGEKTGAGGWELGARKTRLVVYDLLGRRVATLVDEVKAPGNYEVNFDARGLASGVYIYRLTAGSFARAKMMVLLR